MDDLRTDDLNREAYQGLETDLRERDESEWDEEEEEEVSVKDLEKTLTQSERNWDIERNLRRMSEKELADLVDDLDPVVKGKLWAALENNRHD
jgi:hypothetical protein